MGVVFQVAVQIGNEMPVGTEIGDSGAGTGREDADIMGDVSVGADWIYDYGLDDVFAGETVDVESELVVGAAPLAEIDRMSGGDVEDLEIFPRRLAVGFESGRGFGRRCLGFGRGDVG